MQGEIIFGRRRGEVVGEWNGRVRIIDCSEQVSAIIIQRLLSGISRLAAKWKKALFTMLYTDVGHSANDRAAVLLGISVLISLNYLC